MIFASFYGRPETGLAVPRDTGAMANALHGMEGIGIVVNGLMSNDGFFLGAKNAVMACFPSFPGSENSGTE